MISLGVLSSHWSNVHLDSHLRGSPAAGKERRRRPTPGGTIFILPWTGVPEVQVTATPIDDDEVLADHHRADRRRGSRPGPRRPDRKAS